MIFLSIASVLGYAVAFRYVSGRHFGVLIFVTTCAVGSVVYLSALAGLLRPAAWLLLVGGFVAAGGTLIAALRHRRLRTLGFVLSPAVVALLLSCALFHLQLHDRYYVSMDEYYNWGKLTKYLMLAGELPGSGVSPMQMRTYAPGTGLFQYLLLHPGSFDEGGTKLAHFYLLLAGLMVLWDGVSWRRVHHGLLPFLASLGLLLLFGNRLDLLHVEGILAVHLAALLLMARRLELDYRTLLWFVPPLFFLPLVKNAGIPLSMTAAAVVLSRFAVDRYFERRAERGGGAGRFAPMPARRPADPAAEEHRVAAATEPPRRIDRRRWTTRALRVGTLILVGLAGILAAQSWEAHCRSLGLEMQVGITNILPEQVMAAFSPAATAPQRVTIHTFVTEGLTRVPLNEVAPPSELGDLLDRAHLRGLLELLALDLRSWCLLLTLLCLLCVMLSPDRRDRWTLGIAMSWVLAFFAVYVYALLLAYLFRISPLLTSFARYVNAYIAAAAIFLVSSLIALLVATRNGTPRRHRRLRRELLGGLVGALLVAFIFLMIWDHTNVQVLRQRTGKPAVRVELDPQAAFVKSVVPSTSRIFLVSQGDAHYANLLRLQVMSYELTPWPTNHDVFSVHRAGGEGDTGTLPLMSPEEWASILIRGGYDYVYLVHVDEHFWQVFGSLFAPGVRSEDALFAVTQRPEGGLALLAVPGSPAS